MLTLATDALTASHIAVHVIIFLAYLGAVIFVPSSFRALICLSWSTMIFGGGFFLFCGLTHFGLAIDHEDDLFFTVSDHLQAVCIVGFLIFLSWDLQAALRNLRLAFKAIQAEYGDQSDHIIALITQALRRGR